MAQLAVVDKNLVITMSGMDKVWTLYSLLTIPLASIAAVTVAVTVADTDLPDLPLWQDTIAGSLLPGRHLGGVFRHQGHMAFYDFDPEKPGAAIFLTHHDDTYTEMVIAVDDSAEEVAIVRPLIGA